MANRNLKNVPFWKLALRLGVVFIIIVMIIQLLWELLKTGNFSFITNSFENGSWLDYAVSRLIFGAIYGVVTAYFLKRKSVKK